MAPSRTSGVEVVMRFFQQAARLGHILEHVFDSRRHLRQNCGLIPRFRRKYLVPCGQPMPTPKPNLPGAAPYTK
jgi:hypothetical protein